MYPAATSNSPRKALIILGGAILSISTFGLFFTHHDSSSSISSLHLSTTQTHAVTFSQRDEYFDLSPEGDANWTALLPPNGGFVSHQRKNGNYEMAGLTMFHQLHCLQMIRAAIQDLSEGNKELEADLDSEEDVKMGDVGMEHSTKIKQRRHGPHLDQEHWVHCLDYLMQVSLPCTSACVSAKLLTLINDLGHSLRRR
jgi:hypothetical protein